MDLVKNMKKKNIRSNFDSDLSCYVEDVMSVYTDELTRLVRIRSESQDPQFRDNLSMVLQEDARILSGYGFSTIIVPNHEFPVLVGTRQGTIDETILVYNHLDVQPAKPEGWDLGGWGMEHPFDPKVVHGVIKGRGTTDDKGPALAVIHAVNFLHQYGYDVPTIKIVHETEEESGSVHFGRFLDENKKLLSTPGGILVSDTIFEGNNPTITYSLRGLVRVDVRVPFSSGLLSPCLLPCFEVLQYVGGDERLKGTATSIPAEATMKIIIRDGSVDEFIRYAREVNGAIEVTHAGDTLELKLLGGKKDVHSGIFGGVAINPLTVLSYVAGSYVDCRKVREDQLTPLTALSVIVSQAIDASTGHVKIPGFYNGVTEFTDVERKSFERIAEEVDLAKGIADEGIRLVYTNDGVEARRRLWRQPTFEVHGFAYDFEEGVIKLKTTMRLVDQQDPETIKASLQGVSVGVISSAMVVGNGTSAVRSDLTHSYIKLAADACVYGYGKEPTFVGSGGSIGSLPPLMRMFPDAPLVLIAMSKMSDGYHAQNEKFELAQGQAGMRVMAKYLHSIAIS